MSDRQKHTPTPPSTPAWDESSAFREAFLYHFTQTEDEAALRHVGAMLHEFALEFARYWPDAGASSTRTELQAAAADLRHLEGFLRSIGRERDLSDLSKEDQVLSELAESKSDEVGRLAEEIEGKVKVK